MLEEYLNERITINLEDFLKCFCKKWKLVLLLTVFSAGIFFAVSYMIGEEITAPPSEEYIYYENNLARIRNYQEHSILMQLDPLKIYEETIFLRNISDKELLKNHVTSACVWENLETDRSKLYVSELVVWNESEETDAIEVALRHATEEECREWMEYLKEQIKEFDSGAEVIDGSSDVVTDDYVLERQQKKYMDIDFAETLLEESQAGYTIEVRGEVAAVVGMISGVILSSVIIMFQLILKKNK